MRFWGSRVREEKHQRTSTDTRIKYGIFEDAFENKALISTYEPYKDLYEAFIDPGLEPYGAWPGPATEGTAYAHELPSRFSQYSLQLPDELQNRIQDVQDQSTK